MNFYEILKTKKLGRGSPDYWTQLFAEHVGGKGEWKVAELTGTLPMTFKSNGTALINYRIFGTAEGVGVQTEQHGYKIPLTVSGTETKTTDIYIGDSKLGEAEYVDYQEQKMYRRGENLTDWNKTSPYAVNVNLNQDSATLTTVTTSTLYPAVQFSKNSSGGPDSLGLLPGKEYLVTYVISNVAVPESDTGIKYFCLRDYTNRIISSDENPLNVEGEHRFMFTFQKGAYLSILLSRTRNTYISSLTMSKIRITEFTPTDPPLPLPEISTYKGENILDSTETLGEVTIKGQIKPQS